MPEATFLLRVATLATAEGEITILANHMPMVALLVDGEMRINTGQKEVSIAIAGGFLETAGTREATVLSDFAAESDSIEIARVEAAKARAEQLLVEKKERSEIMMVERDMQRAILQLKVAEKMRARRRTR
jgi:F-type H+-transporting ATPase subunit epsilon